LYAHLHLVFCTHRSGVTALPNVGKANAMLVAVPELGLGH
jgi:hypothetical protein